MRIPIFNKNNEFIFYAHLSDKPACKRKMMSENSISITFTTPNPEELQTGDYIIVDGDRYLIEESCSPVKISDCMYSYSPTFHGLERSLKQVLMMDVANGTFKSDFSFKGNAQEHVTKLANVMSRLGVPIKLGTVVETETIKTINYRSLTCFDAATKIANEFGVQWGFQGGYFYMDTPTPVIEEASMNFTYKGKISTDSNIPYLLCGGSVSAAGNLSNQMGEDSYTRRNSTGRYIITLPEHMKGDPDYLVILSTVNSDNYASRMEKDTNANCFWVNTWQSPGKLEDTEFTYTVYKAEKAFNTVGELRATN